MTLFDGTSSYSLKRRVPVGEHARLPQPGLVRADHPETSRAAALAVAPRAGTQRARVLDYIAARPSTDREIQDGLGMSGDTERPRRVELVDGGHIVDSGKRRRTEAGGVSIVWRLASPEETT